MKKITRTEAYELLVPRDIKNLTLQTRIEWLEIWTIYSDKGIDGISDPSWKKIPRSVQAELLEQNYTDPEHPRFDLALTGCLPNYIGSRNSFLLAEVKTVDSTIKEITGKVEELVACPCCGARNLGERGFWEICSVCWWEDDGQDNKDTVVFDERPDGHTGLSRARLYFILHGISQPDRHDLIEIKESIEQFYLGREFVFDEKTRTISEIGTDWKSVFTVVQIRRVKLARG